jgi:hypothetical protein
MENAMAGNIFGEAIIVHLSVDNFLSEIRAFCVKGAIGLLIDPGRS